MTGPGRKYSFYVEPKGLEAEDRPARFLAAFAAALEHSSYQVALDAYSRASHRCGHSAAA